MNFIQKRVICIFAQYNFIRCQFENLMPIETNNKCNVLISRLPNVTTINTCIRSLFYRCLMKRHWIGQTLPV